MKIICINQFYPPDNAPTGRYLSDIVNLLSSRGHSVRVITSDEIYISTKYNQENAKIKVVRSPFVKLLHKYSFMKIVNIIVYMIFTLRYIFLGPKPDVILSLSSPPFIGIIAKFGAKWHGSLHYHWIMDIYPDCIYASLRRQNGILSFFAKCLLGNLGSYQWKNADKVSTLGSYMASRLRLYRKTTIFICPLWYNISTNRMNMNKVEDLRRKREISDEILSLCYSGNLGRGHRWIDFAQAAFIMKNEPIRWDFYGKGQKRFALESWAMSNYINNMYFHGPLASEILEEHLMSADVHLISMETNWEGCLVPSKAQNIFSSGRPMIVVAPKNTELFHWVSTSGAGWAVEPGDISGLISAIHASMIKGERIKRGILAKMFSENNFSPNFQIAKMVNWIEK